MMGVEALATIHPPAAIKVGDNESQRSSALIRCNAKVSRILLVVGVECSDQHG